MSLDDRVYILAFVYVLVPDVPLIRGKVPGAVWDNLFRDDYLLPESTYL